MEWLKKIFGIGSKPQNTRPVSTSSTAANVTENLKTSTSVEKSVSKQHDALEEFEQRFVEHEELVQWATPDDWPDGDLFEEIESRCLKLLPEPNSGFEIYRGIQDPEKPAKEVAEVVAKDPSLVALILREVNSAKYAFGYEIDQIGRAIVLLGYNEVKSIILENSVGSLFKQDENSSKAIKHARVVSIFAYHLAQKTMGIDPHQMSTLGMLHDIGSQFLDSVDDVLNEYNLSLKTKEVMLSIMFIHHWKLPLDFGPWLQKTFLGGEGCTKEVAILGISNQLANALDFGDSWGVYEIPQHCLDLLGLKGEPQTWFDPKAQKEILRVLDS